MNKLEQAIDQRREEAQNAESAVEAASAPEKDRMMTMIERAEKVQKAAEEDPLSYTMEYLNVQEAPARTEALGESYSGLYNYEHRTAEPQPLTLDYSKYETPGEKFVVDLEAKPILSNAPENQSPEQPVSSAIPPVEAGKAPEPQIPQAEPEPVKEPETTEKAPSKDHTTYDEIFAIFSSDKLKEPAEPEKSEEPEEPKETPSKRPELSAEATKNAVLIDKMINHINELRGQGMIKKTENYYGFLNNIYSSYGNEENWEAWWADLSPAERRAVKNANDDAMVNNFDKESSDYYIWMMGKEFNNEGDFLSDDERKNREEEASLDAAA